MEKEKDQNLHHTSITLRDIEKLREPRKTYLDILIFDEEEVAQAIKNQTPVARVIFTRLEPKQKVYLPDRSQTVFSSVEYAELTIGEKQLYDLKGIDRAMCLAIGRYAHNHFRPFLAGNEGDMDPYVSREHGLVFLNEHGQVCYHDIGTFKKGSTNGTKLNDQSIIQNQMIEWRSDEYFGLGETLNVVRDGKQQVMSKFKMRYELL
ncbi:MAG: FHA domain-containing protein [Planctomycetes bacterium]|nr:FHA domain-containing protein [Planctomycetota bacterium]